MALPLFIFLHGLNDSIENYNHATALPQTIADRYRWLVVMPQALDASVDVGFAVFNIKSMWNANMAINLMGTTITPNSEVDDEGFLLAMMDSLETSYSLDSDSIFLAGFSMGGFMTHRMAIEHGDLFTAAVTGNGLITLPLAEQTPTTPVRLMHIHGTADNIVTYDGHFYMPSIGDLTVGIGAEQTVAYWVEHNGCSENAIIDSLPDRRDDGLRFVRHTYANTTNGAEVQFLQVIGGEHVYYSDAQLYDVDYTTEIHDFFTGRHTTYVGCETTTKNTMTLYPNPVKDRLFVNTNSTATLTLYDITGRIVRRCTINEGTTVINISSIPTGIYYAKMSDGTVRRVVKK